MRVAGIIGESIVNGDGFRFVVFAQGCLKRCVGCQNPETWKLDGGVEMEIDEIVEQMRKYRHNTGLTISGGEPFLQAEEVQMLIDKVRQEFPEYDIWCYTGYTADELIEKGTMAQVRMIRSVDILVDGQYQKENQDLSLRYRGSNNQRLIKVSDYLVNKHAMV